jgi:uncharacterized protein (DUF1778 family)
MVKLCELAFVTTIQQYQYQQNTIRLDRMDFATLLTTIDAPSKPNAALSSAKLRHSQMIKATT